MKTGGRLKVADLIRQRLEAAFLPSVLVIDDQSERHRGHAGWREGGETHFSVEIAAAAFAGMSRIDRHRAVHDALSPEPLDRIHALSLKVSDS